jgi:hypothetical protein
MVEASQFPPNAARPGPFRQESDAIDGIGRFVNTLDFDHRRPSPAKFTDAPLGGCNSG